MLLVASLICSLYAIAQTAQSTITHIMQKGETLQTVAARYSTTTQAIIELNPEAADFTYVGMELKIPVATPTYSESTLKTPISTSASEYLDYNTANSTQQYADSYHDESEVWNPYGIGYIANFSNNGKGFYGFTYEYLPYSGGLGFYMFYGTGWGVVSDDFDLHIRIGPTFGHRYTENIMFSCPISFTGTTFSYLKKISKTGYEESGFSIAFGLAANPRVGFKVGKHGYISLGLDLNYCFKTKKTTTIEATNTKLDLEYGGTPYVGFTVSIGAI